MESQGEAADPQKIIYLQKEFNLDQPIWKQYLLWIGGILQGDFGRSIEYDLPVIDVIGEVFIFAIILNASVIAFIYIVAFPIGVYSATHQYSWGDHGLTFVGFIGLATPNFLLALILMFLAKKYLGISMGGLMDSNFENQPWTLDKVISVLEHLIVPVIVIGTSGTAGMIRRLRANLFDELHKQYVTTARAKGLAESSVLIKHALRNALLPIITIVGIGFGLLLGGVVVTENVFAIPGLGRLLVNAITHRDYPIIQGTVLLLAAVYAFVNLLTDLSYAYLDPRIRYGGE